MPFIINFVLLFQIVKYALLSLPYYSKCNNSRALFGWIRNTKSNFMYAVLLEVMWYHKTVCFNTGCDIDLWYTKNGSHTVVYWEVLGAFCLFLNVLQTCMLVICCIILEIQTLNPWTFGERLTSEHQCVIFRCYFKIILTKVPEIIGLCHDSIHIFGFSVLSSHGMLNNMFNRSSNSLCNEASLLLCYEIKTVKKYKFHLYQDGISVLQFSSCSIEHTCSLIQLNGSSVWGCAA
jgi:hypothetical protein